MKRHSVLHQLTLGKWTEIHAHNQGFHQLPHGCNYFIVFQKRSKAKKWVPGVAI